MGYMIRAPDRNPADSCIRDGRESGKMNFNINQERRFQDRSRKDTRYGKGVLFFWVPAEKQQKNDKIIQTAVLGTYYMAFFTSAITTLQILVTALGAGLGVWGVINLLEGYGNDNPGAKSQGMKQLMAGGGVALIGTQLIPLLSGLFS